MDKKSFAIQAKWVDMMKKMDDKDLLDFMRSMIAVQEGEEYEIENPMLDIFFETYVVPAMHDSDQKYKAQVERTNKLNAKRSRDDVVKDSDDVVKSKNDVVKNSDDIARDKDKDKEEDKVKDKVKDKVEVLDKEQPTVAEKSKTRAHKHGEYGHVRLTDEQLQKLEEEHGQSETATAIKKVDEYCEETGKTYKNYYLVIKRWGYTATPTARSGTPGYVDAINNRFDVIKDWLEDSKNDTGGVFADSGSYEGGIHRPEIPAG